MHTGVSAVCVCAGLAHTRLVVLLAKRVQREGAHGRPGLGSQDHSFPGKGARLPGEMADSRAGTGSPQERPGVSSSTRKKGMLKKKKIQHPTKIGYVKEIQELYESSQQPKLEE